MKKISCCINTYRRPSLLRKLLDSLYSQNLNPDISLEIIVVDNDIEKQAENVVKEFQQTSTINIKYFVQPIKNISLTRNKAVKEATGEYILFIDDDGYADANWISEMVKCITEYKADAVFGAVISYFDEGTPEWIEKNFFFDRLIQKTGEPSKFTRTGNCIIKSKLIKDIEGPFDPQFGLSGGEDGNLFGRLSSSGAKFIFCAEGIVYDYVPKERANFIWIAKRTFAIGITSTKMEIFLSKNRIVTRILLLFKAVTFSLISIFLSFLFLPIKTRRIHWFLKFISNIGHIAAIFNFKYLTYNK